MEELKDLIIKFFKNDKKFHTILELRKKLNIHGESQTDIFNSALNSLIEDGRLFFDEKKGYKIFTNDIGYAYGEIEINKSGHGFVHTKDGYKIFIENTDLNGALDGDKVIINSIDFGRRHDFKGEVYKVLKRKSGNVVFEVIGNGLKASLVPYNKYNNINVSINKNQLKDVVDGDLILIKVGTECFDNEYVGEVEKIIGHKTDPNIDIKLLADKYKIPIDFSKEAIAEANSLPKEVKEEDLIGRVDLRDKNIITIDCDDTKDRDDAIYVEKLENGNYKLITSIAAINYYIKRGSKLFEEALIRNTSHYPNNTCIPMFPHIISNGICSLNPNVDRLTKSVEVEITPNGEIINVQIYKSVINSKKAMKYSEVNDVLEGKNVDGYDEFISDLKNAEELSNIYDRIRSKRNCIDFDLPDIKIIQDNNNTPIEFKHTGQGKAEKIIENLMLITNSAIASYYSWLPFIYRVHEYPDEDSVKNAINLLRKSGFDFPKINNINHGTINSILNKISTGEEAKIVREILLRSMKRAKYDTNNLGHFALQLEEYCHFTSPIRRIVDFTIHTIIDEIEENGYDNVYISNLTKELQIISENASKTERIAKSMEEEALAMAMAEYMEKHIGEEFEVYVTDISQYGMFVRTKDLISGKIKFENMLDDKYYYDYEKRAIIGKKTRNKYQIGNKLYVIAKDASKANRTVRFEFGNQKKIDIKKNNI